MAPDSSEKKRSSDVLDSDVNSKESSKRRRTTTPESNKKIYSFDQLLEIMKPSKEELEFREEQAKKLNIENTSKHFKCTKCSVNMNPIIKSKKKVTTHPCLNVLMCNHCREYYLDGEFSVDSDGEEKYCRWCGEGGAIFACSRCICGFCRTCIKKHFNSKFVNKVRKKKNWLCFFCDPKPLWKYRFICSLALKACENESFSESSSINGIEEEKSYHSNSSEPDSPIKKSTRGPPGKSKKKNDKKKSTSFLSKDELNVSFETPKLNLFESSSESAPQENEDEFLEQVSNALIELVKILTLTENHMKFGMAWASKSIKRFKAPTYRTTPQDLVGECQKIKQFLSLLSTYLVQFSNSVDSVECNLMKNVEENQSVSDMEVDQSPYTTILQFLGFVDKQVKLFRKKGFTFSNILDSEVYDDGDIIGLKKKSTSSNDCSDKNLNTPSEENNVKTSDNIETESTVSPENHEENSQELIQTQDSEKNIKEDSSENCESNDSRSSPEVNDIKSTDPKKEIQEILAILENA